MDVSRHRQRARCVYEEIAQHLDVLLGHTELLAASPYVHRIKCGKPGCKCAQGEYRHEMQCISYMEKDKSRTRVIPKGKKKEVLKMTRAYKLSKRSRRKMKAVFDQLLSEIDEVGKVRCEQGMERFARLCAESKRARTPSSKKGG